jgi:hypothetical protein
MKRFVFATLSAAVIATLAASSASEAALINFTLATIDGSPTYAGGSTLDQSTSLDFDDAFLVVQEVGATDVSGLSPGEIGAVSVFPRTLTTARRRFPSPSSCHGQETPATRSRKR